MMKIKKNILFLLALVPMTVPAQIVMEDDQTDVDLDDEIILTDQQGNIDEIEFPESMGVNMDSLMNLYNSKTYLTESGCTTAAEDVTIDRSEYVSRLYRMPTVMEMPYNDVVRACIDRYTVRMRRGVSYMLGASNFYMPIFEEALETYELPLELKYLPVIESALNPTAVSRAGATGLWQFMLGTLACLSGKADMIDSDMLERGSGAVNMRQIVDGNNRGQCSILQWKESQKGD